jgi:NAD(P)-dependent dehydrogenase (short-subunit alcohol dehydrogenase family)
MMAEAGIVGSELLAGRVALVTGASSGNGRAIARRFAEHGARVVLADLKEEAREGGPTTLSLIEAAFPGRARFVRCDVSEPQQIEAAVAVAEELGGLDVMVNNAGILLKQPILDATEDLFETMVNVNIKSVYFGTKAAARVMAPRKRGSIINIGSIAGLRGTAGYGAYCMTKGAVRLMTCAFADELGPMGIRVNTVSPGIMRTTMNITDDPLIGTSAGEGYLELIPARRWGEPEEVADTCLYLASDLSSYTLGANLVVDGGYMRT